MNTRTKNVPATFGPEVWFEVAPAAHVSLHAERADALEHLKVRLLTSRLAEVWDAGENLLLRRAANEAATLAWLTAYPALVFPLLFEEKVETARLRAETEAGVKQPRRELLGA